jgi:hypothetical protein
LVQSLTREQAGVTIDTEMPITPVSPSEIYDKREDEAQPLLDSFYPFLAGFSAFASPDLKTEKMTVSLGSLSNFIQINSIQRTWIHFPPVFSLSTRNRGRNDLMR